MEKKMWAACAALAVVSWARAEAPRCPPLCDVPALVRCALSRSDSVAKARGELQAARGRRITAGQLLPSNPALDVTLGRRSAGSARPELDRGVELSQAIELGGQRGARVAAADVEEAAATAVLAAVERDVVTDVLSSAIAVDRGRSFARHAAAEADAARRLEAVSAGRAAQGAGSALDADLAFAARIEAERASARAEHDAREAEARLVTVAGEAVRLADGVRLPSPWVPGRSADAMEHDAVERRAAVQVARAQARAGSARIDLLRRERVPDVTFGAFLRHEDARDIVGARIGLALPLFRRNEGTIAEAEGRVLEAEAAMRQADRDARLELRVAYARWERATEIARSIPQGMEERLGAALQRLQDAYERGAVPLSAALSSIREVIAARRSLLDARAEALVSSFELAKVAGAALDVSGSRGGER